jgi:hypothetical protein
LNWKDGFATLFDAACSYQSMNASYDAGGKELLRLQMLCRAIRKIDSSTDTFHFINQFIKVGRCLVEIERRSGNYMERLDHNASDPTYFLATYYETENIDRSLGAYRLIKLLTRFIILSDKFHETSNEQYVVLARRIHDSIKHLLKSEMGMNYLADRLEYSLDQFSAFWKFEQSAKRRVLTSQPFSYSELRHFVLSKSSDASLVYSTVLSAVLRNFNESITLILWYNQALLDILDDFEDIEEDISCEMPNVFVMAGVGNIPYSELKKVSIDQIRSVVVANACSPDGQVAGLVNELQSAAEAISVPETFVFLKTLSQRYADTVRGKVSISSA